MTTEQIRDFAIGVFIGTCTILAAGVGAFLFIVVRECFRTLWGDFISQFYWQVTDMEQNNVNFKYVREYYGVPAVIGRRVTVGGRAGIIAADRGHYIGVNFDSDKPGVIRNAHPTSEVEYGDMGVIRKMTRAQKRYSDYLRVAECYESFGHWLKSTSVKASMDS